MNRAGSANRSPSRRAHHPVRQEDPPRQNRGGRITFSVHGDFPIAIVEAKAYYKKPGDGLQQAKEYAEMQGLKFAYATNGKEIVEYDYITGRETELTTLPVSRRALGAAEWTREADPMYRSSSYSSHVRSSPAGPCAITGDCHQSSGAGHQPGQEAGVDYDGDRHRQDRSGVPDLLEALVEPVESHRCASAPTHPLSH